MNKVWKNGRIIGGYSLHEEEMPELCPNGFLGYHGDWLFVDCGEVVEGRDIVECKRCGKQKSVKCDFDDEYS